MQPTGISSGLVRFLAANAPDLLTELFTPGKVLEAEVVSVFQERAVLSFGRGVRLEVALQTPLQEGQRVRVQVQPQEAAPGQPGPPAPNAQTPPPGVQQAEPAPQQPQPGVAQARPGAQQTAPAPQQAPAAPQSQPAGQPAPQLQAGQPAPRPAAPTGQQAAPPAPPGQASRPAPESGRQQTAPAPAPIVLKVIGTAPPREGVRPTAPLQLGQAPPPEAQSAPAPARAATGAPALRDVAAAAPQGQQPTPVASQPAAQPPGAPQVLWLPIPLPDGNQGWAQIHVQEDDSPKTRAQKGGPVQQVRIWWETPALGPVQVTLEAAATNLAALFTAAAAESKGALEESLPELQRRFAQVGFPEARVGCRTAAPGEAVEPARIEGANRLDKRM